jgi:hypothetical protein
VTRLAAVTRILSELQGRKYLYTVQSGSKSEDWKTYKALLDNEKNRFIRNLEEIFKIGKNRRHLARGG